MQDEALLLGPHKSNVGVLTPADDVIDSRKTTAVLCLTAGLLHHVGPHRMHVLLARALSKHGIATLRFDFSGIGDSPARIDDLPAMDVPVKEIDEAIAELQERGFTRFILFAICSGAVQATKAAKENSSIKGLILINIGDEDDGASSDESVNVAAQYYLKRSLWNLQAWKNLFTGKIRYRQLFVTLFSVLIQKIKSNGKKTPGIEETLQQNLQDLLVQGASTLMVLSDRHAQLYAMHKNAFDALESSQFKLLVYSETDHLFSTLSVQQDLIDQVCQWVGEKTDEADKCQ